MYIKKINMYGKTEYKNNNNYDYKDTQKILDYVYSTTEISRFKYKILEYQNDLNILTTQKYYVSANFSGTSSLLVFIKIMDKYYSCLIDRKTLSYNRHQIKIENVKILPINIRFDNSIYNGTIMDGIHVFNKRNHTNVFIMTDVYQFRGQDMTNDSIQHKIMNVSSYINSNLKNDKINTLNLVVNKLYNITDIEELKNTMEKVGGYDMKGIVFYPDISGTKLIVLDTKSQNQNNENSNTNNTNNLEPVAPPKLKELSNKKKMRYRYVCNSEDPIFAVLEVKKTDSPDVYYVSCAEKQVSGGKNIIKIIRLGIAFIPDKETSITCRNILTTKTNGKALMKCQFNQEKNKWVPISEDKSVKLPTFLSEIEKNMELIVESDTESDD